jgi:hypothetical protein
MRWAAILVVAACVSGHHGPKPDLSAPYAFPPYGIASQDCIEVPAACDGYPSTDCICGDNRFCQVMGRDIYRECI